MYFHNSTDLHNSKGENMSTPSYVHALTIKVWIESEFFMRVITKRFAGVCGLLSTPSMIYDSLSSIINVTVGNSRAPLAQTPSLKTH